MTGVELIPLPLLKRKAVVYVRQSTQSQVMTNLESQRRHYDLVDLARQHGFIDVEESAGGIIAAIEAGIAVGLLDCSSLPKDLVPLTTVPGLEPLPPSKLVLEMAATSQSPLAEAMAETVIRSYAETAA